MLSINDISIILLCPGAHCAMFGCWSTPRDGSKYCGKHYIVDDDVEREHREHSPRPGSSRASSLRARSDSVGSTRCSRDADGVLAYISDDATPAELEDIIVACTKRLRQRYH